MNTPAHLIFGLTAFGSARKPGVTTAALFGSLLPDLSLYLLAGTHLVFLGTSPEVVFGELYFSDAWQSIFRIDNSIIIWSIGLGAAAIFRSPVLIAFCGAALFHIGLDLPFHHDDGRAHFWPLTDWIFRSPVSYWDPDHHGRILGSIEVAAVVGCCGVLWRRYPYWGMRALVGLLGTMTFAPFIIWTLMF